MLADFVLELVAAPGVATMALPGVAPAGRLTWASQYHTAQPVLYVLDDTTKEEWGIGTYTPGSPATISRDTVLGNSSGTTAKLNFAGSTRCYPGLPSAYLLPVLGANTGRNLFNNAFFSPARQRSVHSGWLPDRHHRPLGHRERQWHALGLDLRSVRCRPRATRRRKPDAVPRLYFRWDRSSWRLQSPSTRTFKACGAPRARW
jgi:hypothetical protein